MAAAVQTQPVVAPGPLTLADEFRNILTLFFEPGRAFHAIALGARPIVPILLLTALSVGLTALHWNIVPKDVRYTAQIAQAQAYGLGAPAQETSVPFEIGVVALFSAGGTLAVGVAFWFAFRLAGERIRCKTALASCSYALLAPSVVWTITTVVALLIADPSNVDPLRPDRLVATNDAAFLTSIDLAPFLKSVLESIDVFSAWILLLLIVAMTHACGTSRKKACWTVGSVWCLYVTIKSVGATVLASFTR